MRELVRSGDIASQEFDRLWRETEALKNKHAGFPPLPDEINDEQAREMEECEDANEKGLR